MSLTPAEMDELMDRHFAFEMADDVDGVLTTLAPDAQHDIVGAPDGPTIGSPDTRPTYEQVFADLAGNGSRHCIATTATTASPTRASGSAEPLGTHSGIPGRNRPLRFRILHVMEFDDTGLITRENVWLDYPGITAQLTDDPPNTPHQRTPTNKKDNPNDRHRPRTPQPQAPRPR